MSATSPMYGPPAACIIEEAVSARFSYRSVIRWVNGVTLFTTRWIHPSASVGPHQSLQESPMEARAAPRTAR